MIDTNKLKKIKESNKTHHIYIEGEYLYMIRYGDYKNEIEKTQRLNEKGVNFAGPISQIKIDGNQVVVEEYLAKGTSFEKMKDEYKFHSSLDFAKTLEEYELFFSTYLEEIRLRAEANQKIYDKLFNDIIEMNKENLTIDTRSLGNLFFDKTVGFSIIDAYPGNSIPDIKQLFRMIIGNIPSLICIDNNQVISNGVPQNEICVLAPQWRYIFNLTNILKNLLPDISFDAPEISPFKYDPLNPFYILARLVFSEAGKNVNIRKKLAKEFLEIIKNDYNIEISNRYDFLDLLKNANSKDITEKNGISVYEKAVEHIFRSMKVSLSDNEKLLKTYKLFIEKSNNRMAKNDLSSDYDDICSFFKEKQGVVISTIHGVKGEEYNTVIGFGLLNGVIPHWDYILKSDLKPIRESETKKLLYVLMSRAKQNLFLFSENDRITKNGSPLSPTDELSKIQ